MDLGAPRQKAVFAAASGVETLPVPAALAQSPPLAPDEVASVFEAALKLERLFGSPQDMEWTIRNGALYILQARPVTAGDPSGGGDPRAWNLTLKRSFENLNCAMKSKADGFLP